MFTAFTFVLYPKRKIVYGMPSCLLFQQIPRKFLSDKSLDLYTRLQSGYTSRSRQSNFDLYFLRKIDTNWLHHLRTHHITFHLVDVFAICCCCRCCWLHVCLSFHFIKKSFEQLRNQNNAFLILIVCRLEIYSKIIFTFHFWNDLFHA